MALTFAIVLPARYASTRFPGKPLAPIAGKPLIEWVYARAASVPGASTVVVATDDRRIADVVTEFGGRAVMTEAAHETGTDRVAQVARDMTEDVIVNLQGDEPLFDPSLVVEMVSLLDGEPDVEIASACHPLRDEDEFHNPNAVKVVMGENRRALYFSRAPVPHGALIGDGTAHRHIGVYAFRRESLLRFCALPRTELEQSERLEQLRALEGGMRIGLVVADTPTFGVDVPEDVKNVEREIARSYTDSNRTT